MVNLPEGFKVVQQPITIPEGFSVVQPPQKDEFIRGLGQTVAQGFSLGFGDEITAALAAVPAAISTGTSVGEAFNSILDAEREGMEQFSDENPKTALAAELGGGLLTGGMGAAKIAGAKVFKGGTTIPRKLAKGAAASASAAAPIGAIYGAGSAEGGLEERAIGAAKGAAISAVAGPVLSGAAGLTTKLGKGVAGVFRSKETKETNKAMQQIARAMERDGDTGQDIVLKAKDLGDEVRLVDAGKANVKRELERAASSPGQAPEITERALTRRLSRQGVRIQRIFDTRVGQTNKRASQVVEDISDDAANRAQPLYAKAYDTPVNNNDTRLVALLNNPRIQKAIPKAIERIKSKSTDDTDMLQRLQKEIDPNNPNMILWDHVKRHLDDQASAAFKSGKNQLGSDIAKNAKMLRSALDDQGDFKGKLSPYAQARAIWVGKSRAEEAFMDGANFLKGLNNPFSGAAEKAANFNKLSESEKNLFRKGVSLQVRQMVRSSGDNVGGSPPASLLKQIYGNKEARYIINKVIPDQQGRKELSRALRAEDEYRKTTNDILGNSRTALRTAMLEENSAKMAKTAQDGINLLFAVRGNLFAMGRAIKSLTGQGPPSEAVNAKTAKLLLTKGEESIEQVMKDIDRYLVLPEASSSAINRVMKVPKGQRMKFIAANPQIKKEIDRSVAALVAGIYASGQVEEQ